MPTACSNKDFLLSYAALHQFVVLLCTILTRNPFYKVCPIWNILVSLEVIEKVLEAQTVATKQKLLVLK